MKKHFNKLCSVFILLFVHISILSSSQNTVNQYLQISDSLRKIHKLEEALDFRLRAYKVDQGNFDNAYKIATLYSLTRQSALAFTYLNQALSNDSSLKCLSDPELYFIIQDSSWIKLKDNQVKKFLLKSDGSEDIQLKLKLLEMRMKDQAYYSLIDYSNNEQASNIWRIKDSLNNLNLHLLDSIIIIHGWPKISKVGNDGSIAAFLIVQHSDIITQKNYYPLFKKTAQQNEADKKHLATLTDRIRLEEHKKQIYGTQVDYDNEKNKYYFNYKSLQRQKSVNKRRKKVGLEPIEVYLKQWNITWQQKKTT